MDSHGAAFLRSCARHHERNDQKAFSLTRPLCVILRSN